MENKIREWQIHREWRRGQSKISNPEKLATYIG